MSFKYEGPSNADAMNSHVNEPGKGKKGEGKTETMKDRGTVKTHVCILAKAIYSYVLSWLPPLLRACLESGSLSKF